MPTLDWVFLKHRWHLGPGHPLLWGVGWGQVHPVPWGMLNITPWPSPMQGQEHPPYPSGNNQKHLQTRPVSPGGDTAPVETPLGNSQEFSCSTRMSRSVSTTDGNCLDLRSKSMLTLDFCRPGSSLYSGVNPVLRGHPCC